MKFNHQTACICTIICLVIGVMLLTARVTNAQGFVYKIGDRGPAGGWIFYDKGNSSGGWRYLEAAPDDQGSTAWGCAEKSVPEAKGKEIGTGKANTKAIVENCGDSNIAAKLCAAYRGGGKSDWFLPSKDELLLMYKNLYADRGAGGFADNFYWSSTENLPGIAWSHYFYLGTQEYAKKNRVYRVRAVRSF